MATHLHEVTEGFRLSPPQMRVWSLREAKRRPELGVQCIVQIRGRVNVDRLSEAIAQTRRRHEILRTGFAALEGTEIPVQVVMEDCSGLDVTIDFRQPQGNWAALTVQELAAQQWHAINTIPEAPPYSFALAMTADDTCSLVVTGSALCADAASLMNLVREIRSEYHKPGNVRREGLEYADLAEWQNQVLQSSSAEGSQLYWSREEFFSVSFPHLPFELRHTEEVENRIETEIRFVSPESTGRLSAIARRLQTPVHVIIQAAWQLVLHRFSGADEFLIGVTLNGRAQPELQEAIGPLTRCVPLLQRLDRDLNFSSLVREIHSLLTVAQDDQFLFAWEPFGVPPPSQRRCLFPIQFANREQPFIGVDDRNAWTVTSVVEQVEPFELGLTSVTGKETIRLEFAWDAGVFSVTDIRLLGDSLVAILEEIAANPGTRACEFVMGAATPAAERIAEAPLEQKSEWRAIHEIIEDEARRNPGKLAVVGETEQLTYDELNRRAIILGERLQEAGVTADSVIALLAERSPDFIVGMLAVMKAGGAWLPIEPDMPIERIEYMTRAAGAVAVLTQQGLSSSFNHGALPVLYLEDHRPGAISSKRPRHARTHSRQLAYVIFTSGSTGHPKGVAIEHGQIAAYIRAEHANIDLRSTSNFAVVSTLAADLAYTAVFGALTSGGCLHVIPAWKAKDVDALAEYFQQHPIDFIKIVPAHLEALCNSFPQSAKLRWRYVLAGGEQLKWKVVEQVHRLAPECTVFNHYGPTETTIGVVCGAARPETERFAGDAVPIGQPFIGARAYLLDEELQPVPVWTSGALYVGGEFVGRGYTANAALTANAFIPDPFSAKPGARMYRTGDIARYRSDGTMQFLGRRDVQVKINGYRVEPGEIEAVLCGHPNVSNAAVITTQDQMQSNYLTAWVVTGHSRTSAEELRQFLEKSLPYYMIPRNLFCVDKLKLTPNGKIDRQALPTTVPATEPAELREPLDEIEEKLLAVWQEVLGIERISVDDNYFSLGGDSLRVVQLVQETRRYGLGIAATDILRNQTIRRLRKAIQAKRRQSLFPEGISLPAFPAPETIPGLPEDVIDAYPVAGMQKFMLEKYAENQGSQGVYHIQECMHLSDPQFSPEALEAALRVVVDRHAALRTVFHLDGAEPMQWVRRNLNYKIATEDIAQLKAEEQEEHISAALLADRARLFDIGNRSVPLFRVTAFLRSAVEFDLLFSFHHAIMDGWGHRVFTNQLLEAYTKIKLGQKPDFGAPDTTYREFVAVQELVRRSAKAAQFWQNYLSGIDAPERLQPDASDSGPDDPGILHPIEPDLTQALVQLARKRAVSMQALMLTAWLESLRAWLGQEQVCTGVLMNGRSEYLSDPLSAVGLFWNIVPIVSRQRRPLLEQAEVVQKDILDIEPYAAYPLPQLLADRAGREAFTSVFRYLNFWNMKDLPATANLKLKNMRAFDRFSFPIVCSALVGALRQGGFLHVGYDPALVSKDRAQDALVQYAGTLKKLASFTA